MQTTIRVATDQKTVKLLDGAVLFWVVLWCVVGTWTGVILWQAADVGDTITSSGESLSAVGAGLEDLSGVPVIGDRPGEIGSEVSGAAVDIAARGDEVKGQLRQLGVFLGVAVVGIPVVPVLALYLPLRLRRRSETAEIRRRLAEDPEDPGLQRFLADRARVAQPYSSVATLDPAPRASDSDRGLADAELVRLGLRRPTSG